MENTNEKIVKSSIHYYCLNGLYHTMATLALEGQRMYPSDQTFRFYNGLALAFEGRVQEAIRELDRCHNDGDLALGAILALIYSHKKCQVVDNDTVATLETRLMEVRRQAEETTLYYGCLFMLLSRNFDEAEKYIQEFIRIHPNYVDGKVLYGWLIIYHGVRDQDSFKTFLEAFSRLTEPDVLIIVAKVQQRLENYAEAVEKLNQAISLYPRYLPALIEKIKVHAALKEFELLMDASLRALAIDKHCIEPLRYLIIYYLAWDFNEESAISRIRDLISSLELREPKNGPVYYESSRLISRLAFKNQNILLHSSSLIERAVFLEPTNIDYLCEFAFQCALLKRYQESQRHYKNAGKLNAADLKPITGSLIARFMEQDDQNGEKSSENNILEHRIHEEIDQLEEFNKTSGLNQDLLFLCLKSQFRRRNRQNNRLEAIESYLAQLFDYYSVLKNENVSVEFYSRLEVYQLTNIVEICLVLSPPQPLVTGQQIPEPLRYGKELAGVLANVLPNHKEVLYQNSVVKYLIGDIPAALNLANRCLQYDSKFIQVYILMAKISIHDGNFKTANQCLENALVLDFQIRNNLDYILSRSEILKSEKKYQEALELLNDVVPETRDSKKSEESPLELLIQLQMADIYLLLGDHNAARKLIQTMLDRYQQDLIIRGRVQLGQARIYVSQSDYETALQTLQNVSPESGPDNFIRSRQMMAAIYLAKYQDKKKFTDCYREILDRFESQQAQLMLGDAYMHILEPETAIETYEQALKKNPKDYSLVRKVGQSLIKAHYYERAVTYYKAAIKSSRGQNLSFCLDLSQLLCRLKRNEPAKEVIGNALKSFNVKAETDLDVYIVKIKLLHLLARVHLQSGDRELATKILKSAHLENQKLMRRLPVEHPDLLEEHRKFSVGLCQELAQLMLKNQDDQQALQIYKDSLTFDPKNWQIYLAVARIEMQQQNFDQAHSYCTTILKNGPNMEEAILMMADITFRQADFEGALALYRELLEKNLTYFTALARFIEAARRFGKLDMVPPMLDQVEKNLSSPSLASGFYFCRGLYRWYTGDSNEAVKDLNNIRDDSQYGKQATVLMVEICCEQSLAESGELSSTATSSNKSSGASVIAPMSSSLKTAETLVGILKLHQPDDFDIHLLSNLVMLAKRQKADAEYVLTDLSKYLSNERYSEHSGVIYGIAVAYMTLKQTPKARNQLKRVAKSPWKYSEAEYLEKAWLLLADLHIQSNKFDNANELLRRILRYNRSCFKSYELLGFIMEKEQSYRDAAFNYELAWTYSKCNNPAVGYKLAFNYMKSKRFADAIDVAQTVLERYPDYPKIKKDILDKCRSSLKC